MRNLGFLLSQVRMFSPNEKSQAVAGTGSSFLYAAFSVGLYRLANRRLAGPPKGHGRRIIYTLLTLAVLAFTWWLNYWNLLGFVY
jgi:hypothetical protein